MSSPAPNAGPAANQAIEIDESAVTNLYANFARVSSNPEELIIDFGLNAHPAGSREGVEKVTMSQRVIMNHFTAKRLLAALSAGLQRHEQAFGPIEVDIRKRLKAQA